MNGLHVFLHKVHIVQKQMPHEWTYWNHLLHPNWCRAPMLDMDPLNGETTKHASFNTAAFVNQGISMELTRSNEKKKQSVS